MAAPKKTPARRGRPRKAAATEPKRGRPKKPSNPFHEDEQLPILIIRRDNWLNWIVTEIRPGKSVEREHDLAMFRADTLKGSTLIDPEKEAIDFINRLKTKYPKRWKNLN